MPISGGMAKRNLADLGLVAIFFLTPACDTCIRRAIVLPCCTKLMNVTLKLPDDLCKAARHRAIDESKSLSAWMVEQLKRALSEPPPARKKCLIELIGQDDIPEEHLGKKLPLEDRKALPVREFSFDD